MVYRAKARLKDGFMPAYTPEQIHPLFESAFNRGDVEALLALYESNAVIVAGGQPATGHDAIRGALTAFVAGGAQIKLETRSAIETEDGLAVLHGAWTIGPPLSSEGISSEVVRRQADGSWLYIIDIPNTPR